RFGSGSAGSGRGRRARSPAVASMWAKGAFRGKARGSGWAGGRPARRGAVGCVVWRAASRAVLGQPLDELRREMNAAGVLHRYHARPGDVDNDLHLVVGHHAGASAGALAPAGAAAGALARAPAAVRDKLAADPADLAIGLSDVTIVAADSHTMAPPLY